MFMRTTDSQEPAKGHSKNDMLRQLIIIALERKGKCLSSD